MKYDIIYESGLDTGYFGYESVYHIHYTFVLQTAKVDIEIWPHHPNAVRVESQTDGYHWLQFFLCQEPNAAHIIENLSYDEQIKLCELVFAPHGMIYTQEDKESAFIEYPKELSESEAVEIIAKEIGLRFANRERFYKE